MKAVCEYCGENIKRKVGYYKKKRICMQCFRNRKGKYWKEKYKEALTMINKQNKIEKEEK